MSKILGSYRKLLLREMVFLHHGDDQKRMVHKSFFEEKTYDVVMIDRATMGSVSPSRLRVYVYASSPGSGGRAAAGFASCGVISSLLKDQPQGLVCINSCSDEADPLIAEAIQVIGSGVFVCVVDCGMPAIISRLFASASSS